MSKDFLMSALPPTSWKESVLCEFVYYVLQGLISLCFWVFVFVISFHFAFCFCVCVVNFVFLF